MTVAVREDLAMWQRPEWTQNFLETMLDEPQDTPWNTWGCGVAIPAVLSVLAGRAMYLQNFVMYGRRMQRLVISGSDAVWLGFAILGLAAWFHVHFFWTNNSRLAPYSGVGTATALIMLIAGLAVGLFGQFRLF